VLKLSFEKTDPLFLAIEGVDQRVKQLLAEYFRNLSAFLLKVEFPDEWVDFDVFGDLESED
jgi:hypothetical protein